MDKITDHTTGFHYTIIDNYILKSAGLNAQEQIIYIHLKQYAASSSKCFAGIKNIADNIGVSTNTVRKVLRSLKEKGYLEIHQRFNMSNEYVLLTYPGYAASVGEGNIQTTAAMGEGNKAMEPDYNCRSEENKCMNEDSEGSVCGGYSDDRHGIHEMDPQEYERQELEKNKPGFASVLLSYQNNINPVYGSMERYKLLSLFETFEENADILIKAIEVAVLQGARKMRYIESVLLNWHQSGIKTMEQCEAYLKEWKEKRRCAKDGAGHPDKDNGTGDEIPDRYDFTRFS